MNPQERSLQITFNGEVKTISAELLPLQIGRSNRSEFALKDGNSKIRINDPYVSKVHGQISCQNGRFIYQDVGTDNEGSLHGTCHVNSAGGERWLRNDRIALKTSGTLRFGEPDRPTLEYRVTGAPADGVLSGFELHADGVKAFKANEIETASRLLEASIYSGDSLPSRAYMVAGHALQKLGRKQEAVIRLEQYLLLQKNDDGCWFALGTLYADLNQPDKAARCFERAEALNPDWAQNRPEMVYEPVDDPFWVHRTTHRMAAKTGNAIIEIDHFILSHPFPWTLPTQPKEILKALDGARKLIATDYRLSTEHQASIQLQPAGKKDQPKAVKTLRGQYERGTIRFALPARSALESQRLKVVATHEYMHFLLDDLTAALATLPWWFQEGVAQRVSQNMAQQNHLLLKKKLARDETLPLEWLCKDSLADIIDQAGVDEHADQSELAALAYTQAYSLADFLVHRLGKGGLSRIIAELKSGRNLPEAIDLAGVPYASLESDWLSWCRKEIKQRQKRPPNRHTRIRITREKKSKKPKE